MLWRMLGGVSSKIWRRLPKRVRRWGVLLTEARFTVTTGAVITDEQGRVLLLQHRFRPGSGWGIPGGFLQPGEQPAAGLRRELREEVGVEIEQAEVAFIHTLERIQQVEIIFRCRVQGDAAPRAVEIQQAAWFALAELPAGLSADQRGLIARALQRASVEVVCARSFPSNKVILATKQHSTEASR
ncbi:MAG: NUDIX domain-containing protein [Acidobacteria bacterium]|nr:NUDIX domain-containing protein [Acidobacteriota bacterium]MBI3424596.1 NUDIX domain-containing protein [Acidobacteriota bacterium]